MEEADFKVMEKEISETTYLNVRDIIILKFKHQKAPGTDEITADIIKKVGPALWRRINSFN
jgi:hypothetical protein